jgi:tRNA isopentenyl-2-thiomethyl-A-37 hydroxylase MiaE
VQLIFFVAFFCHARGERFLIQAAVPVCALKANGTILFFLRRYRSARRLLICRLLICRLLIAQPLSRTTLAVTTRNDRTAALCRNPVSCSKLVMDHPPVPNTNHQNLDQGGIA